MGPTMKRGILKYSLQSEELVFFWVCSRPDVLQHLGPLLGPHASLRFPGTKDSMGSTSRSLEVRGAH
ncbi:hypothetical protein Y032_0100g3234 [Ancylostoma ceylanicum]|uniref:Uncharacterized protein n=1 Tax=Ancylostoma ceylanicum TaxID=53326 RepID=A0A016TI10_9BILA|nr:hypothetical protein Y032_0100g3234 [Ancylostoma ceylanicum]